jgi:hypothetical protein
MQSWFAYRLTGLSGRAPGDAEQELFALLAKDQELRAESQKKNASDFSKALRCSISLVLKLQC